MMIGRDMSWYEKLVLVGGTILLMECVAWATHKYVMHGWGWGWHRSHHEPRRGTHRVPNR